MPWFVSWPSILPQRSSHTTAIHLGFNLAEMWVIDRVIERTRRYSAQRAADTAPCSHCARFSVDETIP
jgi:hypothetical protein